MLGDYWIYFWVMSCNLMEVWGEYYFYLNVVFFCFFGCFFLIINDLDVIQYCFIGNVVNYCMNLMCQVVLCFFLCDGLLIVEGEIWKMVCKVVFFVFILCKVKVFVLQILKVCEVVWDLFLVVDGWVIFVIDVMVNLILNVLIEILFFGDEVLDKVCFNKGICDLIEISGIFYFFDLLYMLGWVFCIGYGVFNWVIWDLCEQVGEFVVLCCSQFLFEQVGWLVDFFDLLLGVDLDDIVVVDNLLIFFVVGYEIIVCMLIWILYFLFQLLDIFVEVEQELDMVELDCGVLEMWMDVLFWIMVVIKESLCFYFLVLVLVWFLINDDVVGGVFILVKIDVLVLIWLLYCYCDFWLEVDDFCL